MIKKIIFCTGSATKLNEVIRALNDPSIIVEQKKLALDEIQSLDADVVVERKLAQLKDSLELDEDEIAIVEDTSFYIDSLNGLPGTFVKFFLEKVGADGMHTMARAFEKHGRLHARGEARIGVLGASGDTTVLKGVVHGHIVADTTEAQLGWGFDKILIPDGYDAVLAELGPDIKSQISHRANAVHALKDYLKTAS